MFEEERTEINKPPTAVQIRIASRRAPAGAGPHAPESSRALSLSRLAGLERGPSGGGTGNRKGDRGLLRSKVRKNLDTTRFPDHPRVGILGRS